MLAHRADLRVEVEKVLRGTGDEEAAERAAAFADDVAARGPAAADTPRLAALLEWTERLTRDPAGCTAEHVEALRAVGLDDRAVHDAAQVVAYFNYINRIADGLGVDLEPDMPPRPAGPATT